MQPTLSVDNNTGDYTSTEYNYPYYKVVFFDTQTGEQVDWKDMISVDYKELEKYNERFWEYLKFYTLNSVANMSYNDIIYFSFYSAESDTYVELEVPTEYINW